MSNQILADHLDDLIAVLADFGDYIVETDEVNEHGAWRSQATLERFAGDALRDAIQARRFLT